MSDPMGISPAHLIITVPNKNGISRYNNPMKLRDFLDRVAVECKRPESMEVVYEDADGNEWDIVDVRFDGDTITLVGE